MRMVRHLRECTAFAGKTVNDDGLRAWEALAGAGSFSFAGVAGKGTGKTKPALAGLRIVEGATSSLPQGCLAGGRVRGT